MVYIKVQQRHPLYACSGAVFGLLAYIVKGHGNHSHIQLNMLETKSGCVWSISDIALRAMVLRQRGTVTQERLPNKNLCLATISCRGLHATLAVCTDNGIEQSCMQDIAKRLKRGLCNCALVSMFVTFVLQQHMKRISPAWR